MKHFEGEDQNLDGRCGKLEKKLEAESQDFEQRLKGLNTLVAKHSQKMEAIDVALGELQASAADVLFEGCLQENQAKLSLEASAEGELGAVAKMQEQMVRVEEPQKEEICEAGSCVIFPWHCQRSTISWNCWDDKQLSAVPKQRPSKSGWI